MIVIVEANRFTVEFFEHVMRQRVSRTSKTDALAIQTQHGGGVTKDKTQIVRHHDAREISLFLQSMNQFIDMLFARFIDARGRFIQKQNVRLADQGKSN